MISESGSETAEKRPSKRFRCAACGNLTRFDVFERRYTRSFYHFTLGGDLEVEEVEVLDHDVEKVVCRWCQSADHIEEVEVPAPGGEPSDQGDGTR